MLSASQKLTPVTNLQSISGQGYVTNEIKQHASRISNVAFEAKEYFEKRYGSSTDMKWVVMIGKGGSLVAEPNLSDALGNMAAQLKALSMAGSRMRLSDLQAAWVENNAEYRQKILNMYKRVESNKATKVKDEMDRWVFPVGAMLTNLSMLIEMEASRA